MEPLWHGEFENHFNANMEEKGTILASYGLYGQYEGKPLKRGFHEAIPTTKLERVETLKDHELETDFNAKM